MENNYIKPGWKTTEFWAMVMCAFFGILIVTGVISNKESNDMLAYVNNIMGSGVTIVSVSSYIFSRGKAKTNNIDYEKLIERIDYLVNKK